MARKKTDPDALMEVLADHVLEHGLNSASLRPMAAAAGTSDRMLIYHFGSKEGLIAKLLEHLAARMAAGLGMALPAANYATQQDLVWAVVGVMRSAPFQPYARVWLDIVSAASQGNTLHRNTGKAIMGIYLDWLAERHPDGAAGAPATLMLIEGALVLDAVGCKSIVDSAIS